MKGFYHPIIGIVVIAVLFFQPIGGYLAHRLYAKNEKATSPSVAHRWIGRIFLVLGAINGGLGLQLGANSRKGEIAYGVITGVSFAIWGASILFDHVRSKKKANKTEA